ncbi:hypothetical protein ACO1O0_001291 [Amphichorda felina]
MKTSFAALLLVSLASGFNVHQYPSKQCTGSQVSEPGVNADKGCVVAREDSYTSGLINEWAEDADSSLVLALYSDTSCCHANLIKTVDWEDSCIEIESGVTVGSFRAVDPANPDGGGSYSSCEAASDDDEERPVAGVPPTWEFKTV